MVAVSSKHKAVESIDDIRGRCVIRAGCTCWHWRYADGRQMHRALGRHPLWFRGKARSLLSVVYELATGEPVPRGFVAYRRCMSYDCANPAHIAAGTRAEAAMAAVRRDSFRPQSFTAAENGRRRAKLTPELRCWLLESQQSADDAAHALAISRSTVYVERKRLKRIGSALAMAWRGTA